VSSVSTGSTSAFLHVQGLPAARVERTKLLLILLADPVTPPPQATDRKN